MKTILDSKICAYAQQFSLPLGIGAALAASNGLAIGAAVGTGLLAIVAFRRP